MWKRQQWKHRHITISQNRTASNFTTRKNRQKSKWMKHLNRFRIVSFNSQWISNHKNKWYYNNIFFASICTNMRCINCSTNCTAVARIRQRRADRYFTLQLQTRYNTRGAIWNLVYVPLSRHPSTVNKFQRFASVRFSGVANTRFAIHHPAKCFAKCSFDPGWKVNELESNTS